MLRNYILALLAVAIWAANYLVYFAEDIRAARRRRHWRADPVRRERDSPGPLPPRERRPFPPPQPPPHVQDAEVISFPQRRRPGG